MKYTNEQLFEKYKKLPADIQSAITSIDSSEIIQKIAKENELNVEKMGLLADEVGLLMLGITHPNQFISNLTSRLGIDKSSASKIGKEVNAQIFSKIRESLKKIHEISTTTSPSEKLPTLEEVEIQTTPKADVRVEPPKSLPIKPPELATEIIKRAPTKEPLVIEPRRSFSEAKPKLGYEPEKELEFIDETTKFKKKEKPAFAETTESKDIIQERNKDQIFRSKTETTEKPLPPKKSKPTYPSGSDPYREPLK